ncbi:MAG TPA: hypothetical protein VF323_12425 [Candidatus Limnocylindrales bacterium]
MAKYPDPAPAPGGAVPVPLRPAGFCVGPGHMVVYGNAAFVAEFGHGCVGLPAREGMLGLPADAFAVLDAVFASGRPLARWIRRDEEDWRLTAAPRVDPETAETYGVAFHLRARSDTPILRAAS